MLPGRRRPWPGLTHLSFFFSFLDQAGTLPRPRKEELCPPGRPPWSRSARGWLEKFRAMNFHYGLGAHTFFSETFSPASRSTSPGKLGGAVSSQSPPPLLLQQVRKSSSEGWLLPLLGLERVVFSPPPPPRPTPLLLLNCLSISPEMVNLRPERSMFESPR